MKKNFKLDLKKSKLYFTFHFSKFFPPADYEFPCVFLGGIPYKSSYCLIAVTDSLIPRFPNCRIPYIAGGIPQLPDSLNCLWIPRGFPELPDCRRIPVIADSQFPTFPNCRFPAIANSPAFPRNSPFPIPSVSQFPIALS